MPATFTYSPVQPLKGLQETRMVTLSYRALSPHGDGVLSVFKGIKSVTQTANSSLLTGHSSYTFSAKEKDSETGLSYFGSRYYSSDLSVWLSVDPQASKYPSLSPYVYCANNPVRCVDPDGEEIWIIGEDGSRIKYVQGMTYEGHDESISNKVKALNQMNSTKNGRRLLDKLTSSNNFYSITDNIDGGSDTKDAYFCANDLTNGKAGGAIITQGINDLRTISHELFHAYQDECGQGGSSVHNEVEAMLFQTSVITEYGWNNKTSFPASPLLGNVKAYNNIVDDLLDGYSPKNINNVINYFKKYSGANKAGTYKNYPPKLSNQSRDIIQDFYPLLPWKK